MVVGLAKYVVVSLTCSALFTSLPREKARERVCLTLVPSILYFSSPDLLNLLFMAVGQHQSSN